MVMNLYILNFCKCDGYFFSYSHHKLSEELMLFKILCIMEYKIISPGFLVCSVELDTNILEDLAAFIFMMNCVVPGSEPKYKSRSRRDRNTCESMGQCGGGPYKRSFHWRGEERHESCSHRSGVVGGPGKGSFWDTRIKKEQSLFIREDLLLFFLGLRGFDYKNVSSQNLFIVIFLLCMKNG
jgi:hypothetical protein